MSIITLTTDYGIKDHFVGAVKGKIFSLLIDAKIVDISHNIFPFNLAETSYIIGAAYSSFPNGTIHIIGVDIIQDRAIKHVIMLWQNQFFICANNGILSMLTEKIKPQKIYEINSDNYASNDFSDIDLFVQVACHIAKGGLLTDIGKEISELKQVTQFKTTVSENNKILKGIIIYIDNYGNAVTNITKEIFLEVANGRTFEINFKNINLKTIFAKYSDILLLKDQPQTYYDGQKMAVFNEANFLEIAMYKSSPTAGSAKTMFGFIYGDVVTIEFND